MAATDFTKQSARRASQLAGEMFDALPKSKRSRFLGSLNEICLFIEQAQREAPESPRPPRPQEPVQVDSTGRRKFTFAEIESIVTILRDRVKIFAGRCGGNPLYEFDDLTDVSADLQAEMPPMIILTFNVSPEQAHKLTTLASQAVNPF